MNEEEKMLKEVTDKVTEVVLPAVTEKALETITEKIALRKDLFGDSNNQDDPQKEKEKSAEFLKELATKSLTSGDSTSGAELVPTFLSSQYLGIAQAYGLVRRKARKWPMEGMNVDVPTIGTVQAFRLNADGSKVQSSKPTTGTVPLRSKTIGLIVPVSKKLLRNSAPALVDALNFIMGKSIAKLEDTWALPGLEAGEGLLGHASVPTVTLAGGDVTYNKVQAEDLLDVIDKVDDSFFEEGSMEWVMSLSMLNIFRRLRSAIDGEKQDFLFQDPGGKLPPTIWDLPYNLSPVMPKNSDSPQADKKFLGLVNWDYVILGDEHKYEMEVSNQATITDTDGSTLINLFEQNMVALKLTGDIDVVVAHPDKAHAVIKTAAS